MKRDEFEKKWVPGGGVIYVTQEFLRTDLDALIAAEREDAARKQHRKDYFDLYSAGYPSAAEVLNRTCSPTPAQPPSESPKCSTCGGEGFAGTLDESGEPQSAWPCPDCAKGGETR